MSKIDKLIAKLKSDPKDFTWKDTIKILKHFGYKELKKKEKREVQDENLLMKKRM